MIPEEAIDAVARSMAKTCHDRRLPWHAYLVDARLAIEAAAPFIRAQAPCSCGDGKGRGMRGALYARINNYFWLPCPNCGEMFGGWECGKGRTPDPDRPGISKMWCKRCDKYVEEPVTDQERIAKALHQLDVDWGNGTFNYGKLRQILAGNRDQEN